MSGYDRFIRPSLSAHESQRAHPNYWFEDGSVIVRVQNDMFKIHRTLFATNSRAFDLWCNSAMMIPGSPTGIVGGSAVIDIPEELGVQAADFEALLEHLYHQNPITRHSTFEEVARVVRASSPKQCDMPRIFEPVREYFIDMFPSGPTPFEHPPFLEEALNIAISCNIPSVQKGLYYSLVTTGDFDPESPATSSQDDSSEETQHHMTLSPASSQRIIHLMKSLISHFTPYLFTVATASHMACTEAFADRWMPLVIDSAIRDGGVYKPLETLQRIIDIEWVEEGLCAECLEEKRAEWRTEQDVVWEKIDGWLGLTTMLN